MISSVIHKNSFLFQTEIQLFVPKKEVKDYSEVSQVGLQFICVNDRPIICKEIEKVIKYLQNIHESDGYSSSIHFLF